MTATLPQDKNFAKLTSVVLGVFSANLAKSEPANHEPSDYFFVYFSA
jgi:hypothetical protein